MRSAAIFAALVLAGVTTSMAACAVDLPQRKPGLWQVTTTSPGRDMPPRVVQMCMDASTDAAMTSLGTAMAGGVCSRNEITRAGATVTTVSVCKVGQTQAASQAVTRFMGDSAYHTDIKSSFDPPVMGQATAVLAQDAKWTGACPAGMQPGDLVMANGMKLNIKTIMGGQAPAAPR
jgi:hypothetical protein